MKTIYLIGFMGSGKSTIGLRLSKELFRSYIDTDDFIEKEHGIQISEIFQTNGEKTFREYEIDALKQVSSYQIVSTGGGIVERSENLKTMKRNGGLIIYLQTSFQEIARRLDNDEGRPLWKRDFEEKKALYKRRNTMYEKVTDFTIQTDNKSIEEIVLEIKSLIQKE